MCRAAAGMRGSGEDLVTRVTARRRAHPAVIIGLSTALLLGLTALLGVWAAYDRALAGERLASVALGLLLLAGMTWAGWRGGERALGGLALACAAMALGLALYFLLAADWVALNRDKVPALQPVYQWLQARQPAGLGLDTLNPNVAGGALAMLLPLGLGGAAWAWQRRQRVLGLLAGLACFLAAVVLGLTVSRGAWLGLAIGLLVAVVLGLVLRRWGAQAARRTWLILALLLMLGSVGVLLVGLAQPPLGAQLGRVGAAGSAIGRATLWQDGLALIGDYPFTGSGLGSTGMVYSTYGLLIHDFYLGHMHNLFVQTAVEQGVPGLVALLVLLGCAVWALATWPAVFAPTEALPGRALLWLATVAAFVTLVVHGTLDAGLYASRLVALLLIPLGMAFAGAPPARGRFASPRWTWGVWVVVGLLALSLLPGMRAAFQANLGAVAQTRAELAAYRWPEVPIQDALRRDGQVDLGPALAHYAAALALDPANVTANRRLGQIELAQGQYDAAQQHLAAAYAAAPGQRVTRLLLGESQAVVGAVVPAAALWATVEPAPGHFAGRVWWYGFLGETQAQAWVEEAAARAMGMRNR